MGIQFKGCGSSDYIDVSCGEPSESNAGCGVLQTKGKDGLEMVTSVDGSECKERRGKTSAVGVRNGPIGVTNRAQEVGKVANCIIGHGQRHVIMVLRSRQMRVWKKQTGWSLREEAMLMLPFNVSCTSDHSIIMNVIIWNCRGALKPNFQNHVRELVCNHNPAILVVMETHVGRERAREITNRLPFENVIHTDIIGFAGVCGCF